MHVNGTYNEIYTTINTVSFGGKQFNDNRRYSDKRQCNNNTGITTSDTTSCNNNNVIHNTIFTFVFVPFVNKIFKHNNENKKKVGKIKVVKISSFVFQCPDTIIIIVELNIKKL